MDRIRRRPIPPKPTTSGPYRPDPPTITAYSAALAEWEELSKLGLDVDFYAVWDRHIAKLYGTGREGPPLREPPYTRE